jgi:hypothetical protein
MDFFIFLGALPSFFAPFSQIFVSSKITRRAFLVQSVELSRFSQQSFLDFMIAL